MKMTMEEKMIRDIAVSSYDRIDEGVRGAAILIPLIHVQQEPAILFEVRSGRVNQPGEICFPGGHIEEGETPASAAVRETCEELCIQEKQIGRVHTVSYSLRNSGMTVYCHAAELKDYQNTYNPEETDHIFCIPVSVLKQMQPEVYKVHHVTVPEENFPLDRISGGKDYKWGDRESSVYFYDTGFGVIWGLTAFFLHDFLAKI